MTQALPNTEPVLRETPPTGPPDWATLEVALRCPGCGYNLFMLTESRCPECGIPLDWPELLAEARRPDTERWLFEHCWRRRPLRSLAATLGMTLMPWRLWRRVRLTDRPNPMACLALFLAAACTDVLSVFLFYVFEYMKWGRVSIVEAVDWSLQVMPLLLPQLTLAIALPPFAFLLGLMLYRASFVRRRILFGHLVRVVAFSWAGVLLIDALVQVASILLIGRPMMQPPRVAVIAVWVVFAVFLIISVTGGFGRYLGMPLAFPAAVTSAVLGLVIAIIAVSAISIALEGTAGTLWLQVANSWLPYFDDLLAAFDRWWY